MRIALLRRVAEAVVLLSAVAIGAGVVAVAKPATPSAASAATVSFSTTPALFPAFNTDVSDYVVRCSSVTPLQVAVTNTDGSDLTTTTSVDGRTPQTGSFVVTVALSAGKEFTVEVADGATTKDYYVRCLPRDFPTWSADRPGTPQAEYYVVVPDLSKDQAVGHYVIIYDTDGVPVWWIRTPSGNKPFDAKIDANDDVLWTEGLGAFEARLDGTLVDGSITPVGATLDNHDVQLLPNGDYVVIGNYSRCCYDLSGHGGPASTSILDQIVQEVTPAGAAVWTWDAADHIGIDEVVPQWWSTSILPYGSPYDVFHMNSIERDAAGNLLISTRYNGVYKVTDPEAATNPGKVIWKLGGSPSTVEPGTQLTVIGDPVFDAGDNFGGQHYARYYDAGDGNVYVTLHDNGSNYARPPRGVRYRIDETGRTATMVEDVRDNADPDYRSLCCGSAGKLPGGNWVASWGFGQLVMELTPAGDRVFVLTLGLSSYRVDPVLPGVLTRAQLRAGMDTQFAVANEDTDGDGCPNIDEPLLVPPTDPNNQWDFYSVPVPALFAAPDPLLVYRDADVTAQDAQAVFAYFRVGAHTGTPEYEQDLDANGVKDGIQYDRSLVGVNMTGPPDGAVSAQDAQLAFAQFARGYHC